MSIADLLQIVKKVRLQRHPPGRDQINAPLQESLDVMRATNGNGYPVSLVGRDVARLIETFGVWVFYWPTKGSGATPWKGLIILDTNFRGKGQAKTSNRVAMIAHEFTHVLQRRLDDPEYWPSGCLRATKHTRWICDSTNYMEVLAYIVGDTLKHELDSHRLATANLPEPQKQTIRNKLQRIEDGLATLTSSDVQNAKRYVLWKNPGMFFYEQNYRKEALTPGGRVPKRGWAHWLKKMGFSQDTVEHIRELASRGTVKNVSKEEADKLGKVVPGVGKRRVAYLGVLGLFGSLAPLLRSIWESIVGAACSPPTCAVLTWLFWTAIGAAAYGLIITQREDYRPHKKARFYILHWPSLVFTVGSTAFLVHLLFKLHFYMDIDLAVCGLIVDLSNPVGGLLPIGAFFTGYFHQVVVDALTKAVHKNTRKGIKEKWTAQYNFLRDGVLGWKLILRAKTNK